MSRNTQRESFKTPPRSKNSRKPKKITDYSSDSSYAGVDLISDSDDNDSDDEPDAFRRAGGSRIEQYEEAAMLEEDDDLETIEEDTDAQDTPRATNNDEEWGGFEDSSEELLESPGFFEDNLLGIQGAKKRVTFADDDSDSSISEDESVNWHPDLFETNTSAQGPFLSADALPPHLARGLDDNTYNDDPDSDTEQWGNGNNDSDDSEGSDSDDSVASGYQSDLGDDFGGDTTDDEDWRENRPDADDSVPRGDSPAPPPCLGFRIQRKKGQPDVITWYHNTDVPFVILDEQGKDLLINGSMEQYNPVLSNQANIMMSAVSDGASEFGSYHTGNPEAFFENPLYVDDNVGRPTSSSSNDESEDQSEPLQWGDLLHMDATLTDDEDERNDGPVEAPSSTPARPTTSDGLHPLLIHLDKGTNVGAFRLNRQNENLINSNTISKDALAFGTSTIKGVKNGHLDSLTSSLTPRRKLKALMPSSPAGDVAKRKRKSNGSSQGRQPHKRSRSKA
ncbi:51d3973e-04ef-45d0-ba2e-7044c490d12b [Sclerotinia trifoliorum]|uniref:51d3973e-04ef-45d0-ba2e-7044c490d12b n=1 Tax=Sclerotinia trifoliorum TaxID=28548 RepID=A0A8H2VZF3_9HELO|nr:51d3973e-04ef-45d0-ba2e-7044c490d12b [Sclerotinia trifoliorum]